jgi:phosphoribosylanthranilate isomerase
MTARVKICGVTTPEDAALSARLGADAVGVLVGLVHVSEDELPPERAGAILAALPPFVAGTLVTHRTELEGVRRLCRVTRPQVLQLHGAFPLDAISLLRESFPALRIVKTVHVDGERSLEHAKQAAPHVDAILLDTRTATRLGGTGLTHDWSISRRIRDALPTTPVILAGGLTPDNVARAIDQVFPHAVDVNSGVSIRRGQKSEALITRFIRAAKTSPAATRE